MTSRVAKVQTKKVQRVQFGMLSPHEIKNMSVAKIEFADTYENELPKMGGLMDPRLGVNDRNYRCITCRRDMTGCIGHFGHMELHRPVYHIGFLNKIKKTLECVCFFCSKLRVDKTGYKFTETKSVNQLRARVNILWNMCKNRVVCDGEIIDAPDPEDPERRIKKKTGCGAKQPVIKREGLELVAVFGKERDQEDVLSTDGKVIISAQRALTILKGISDEDMIVLGFNPVYARPEWMILTVLPVPPPPVRPSIMMETSLKGEDDLTHKLSDIIKTNDNLKRYEVEGAPGHIIRDYEQLLQFHVATYFDNDISGQPQALQKSGRPLKSITARLKGKEGRLRGNLMGKRVDFSARTVITPDPNLELDEVGVPISIAMNLTVPVEVTPFNIEYLQKIVFNGPYKHPGARYIVKDKMHRVDLRFVSNEEGMRLAVGNVVERHLLDGDYVLFNRQPSLHKMSMMGHRVRVMPYSTFRLNLSVCTPYNADFDGDEMNLHVPQSVQASVELRELAAVHTQIVSPQSNKPVMGIVQDSLVATMLMTSKETYIVRSLFDALLMCSSDMKRVMRPAILKPRRLYTGKQAFSLLTKLTYVGYHSAHQPTDDCLMTPNDTRIYMIDGYVVSGMMCKRTIGSSAGGIIHVLCNDYGNREAMAFFNSLQKMANTWVLHSGFSVGLGDTVADKGTMENIFKIIEEAKKNVTNVIYRAKSQEFAVKPGMSYFESFESEIRRILNKARDDAGTMAQRSLKARNNIKCMVDAGSKGSFINVSQVTACVGQQNIEGKRIPFGFRGRTLPHFTCDDYGNAACGFVENSYLSGLTPQEFFFHAMGGREGLIDTAIKTAETGYIQRRLVKALEDIMVRYDGTVRDGTGKMVQLVYGDDGFDASKLEKIRLSELSLNEKDFSELVADSQTADEERSILTYAYNYLRGRIDYVVPVNFIRLINEARRKSRSATSNLLTREVAFETLRTFTKEIHADDITRIDKTKLFVLVTHVVFSSKRLVKDYSLTTDAFFRMISELKKKYNMGIVSPGEMVGVLAAQSIGEPATQMTLNTFHYAGVLSTVTLGVPRLKEIINVAKNIKTPRHTIYLAHDYSINGAKGVAAELTACFLQDVVARTEIYYDADVMTSVVEEDRRFVELYYELPDDDIPIERLSAWVLRFVLSRERMIDHALSVHDIVKALHNEFGNDMQCITTDDNNETIVCRCRVVMDDGELAQDEDYFLKRIENSMLTHVMLKGVSGIKRTFLAKSDDVWTIETEGVNLSAVMALPNVDYTRVYCNDLNEIVSVLGIEATRTLLLKELRRVIESNGSYVNYRQLVLLCDLMTFRETLMGITRHGVNRNDSGALMRCTFEETVDILLDAAVSGEIDPCKGITVSILMGQQAALGTGCFDLMLDCDMLSNAMPLAHSIHERMPGKFTVDVATPVCEMPTPASSIGGTPVGFSPVSKDGWSPFALLENMRQGARSPYVIRSPRYCGSPSMGSLSGSPGSPRYSPTSPRYSPTSPAYSPTSPRYSPTSPAYSPTSPRYSPTSPKYSPTSPAYSPTSPAYSPTSPKYSPTSPKYSPTSPKYSPTSPKYSPTSPKYSPASPKYSPASPVYVPRSPKPETDSTEEEK